MVNNQLMMVNLMLGEEWDPLVISWLISKAFNYGYQCLVTNQKWWTWWLQFIGGLYPVMTNNGELDGFVHKLFTHIMIIWGSYTPRWYIWPWFTPRWLVLVGSPTSAMTCSLGVATPFPVPPAFQEPSMATLFHAAKQKTKTMQLQLRIVTQKQ